MTDPVNYEAWSRSMIAFIRSRGLESELTDFCGGWAAPISGTSGLIAASPDLLAALQDAIGALEFSQDYHRDLDNEDQAFAADKLDAALKAIAKAKGINL